MMQAMVTSGQRMQVILVKEGSGRRMQARADDLERAEVREESTILQTKVRFLINLRLAKCKRG
jgi:hypothetical protein